MDNFDCSCGGLNDKCFRCFGTGLVESGSPIVGRPHRPLTTRSDTLSSRKKKHNRQRNSGQDQSKESRGQVEVNAIKPLAMVSDGAYINCSQCGVLLRKTRVEHHMSKAHAPELIRSGVEQKTSSTFANGTIESKPIVPPCPICKAQMLTIEELRSHIVDGHGRKIQNPAKRRFRDSKAAAKASKPKVLLPKQTLSRHASTASKLKQHSLSAATQKDDVDALDHPSRLPGSFGTGRRK
jgi:hypothetical protein